jgi:DMSO/TMAO reductase YedYZ molybdopterin-dependent catalytic subunit
VSETTISSDPATPSTALDAVPTPSAADLNGVNTPYRDRLAGLLGAGVALATTELVAGFSTRIPSVIESVGEAVIDLSPSTLVKFGIDAFGTNDKPALAVGIVAICILLGVALGAAARKRFWTAPVAMAAVATVGVLAVIRDPLASGGWALIPATLAVIAGSATIWYLLDLARNAAIQSATPEDRRRFVLSAAGGLGVIAFAPIIGRSLSNRGTVEAARAEIDLSAVATPTTVPAVAATPDIVGLTPLYIPNDDFYRIDTAFTVPQVNPATWSMKITGLVDNELRFTYDDLLARATTEADVTLSCVSNRVGGDLVGNARWLGIPLEDLLEEAGVQPGGTQVFAKSVDGFTAGFPTALVGDGRTSLLAVGMNGEPLPTRHGFPARLVIAGLYGYVSATKWLGEIEINEWSDNNGYWTTRGWSKEGPIKTQSRIDVPVQGVTEGTVTIAGVAWAPTRGISRVEVRVEDGPWIDATLGPDIGDESWVQWWHDFELAPGTYNVTCRATDGTGATQTDERANPAPDGATGHHSKRISVAAVSA